MHQPSNRILTAGLFAFPLLLLLLGTSATSLAFSYQLVSQV